MAWQAVCLHPSLPLSSIPTLISPTSEIPGWVGGLGWGRTGWHRGCWMFLFAAASPDEEAAFL